MTSHDDQPAVLTAAKQTSTTGKSKDGNAVCVNDSTDLTTIAAALTRIADELCTINRNLSVTRHDGTDAVGLARIVDENGASRARR